MSRSSRIWFSFSTASAAMLALCATASAQPAQVTTTTTEPAAPAPPPSQTVVVQPAPAVVGTTTTTSAPVASDPAPRETREEGYVPNRYLLTTGLVLWGASYAGSVIVAAQSSNSADQHLYVPIVGPWIDLANRGGCPVGNASCDAETTNKVMLVVDGVFQAVGTINVIWGFLRPERREVTTVAATKYTPAITFEPSTVASGYGLTAFGKF